ncbi:MAG: DUF72 domain-containing protein [Chthoniobacterales bacterium]
MSVLIGTAGWSLPRAEQENFPGEGSHLERYAMRFPIAEINSSFHRSHRAATWTRWRDSVPTGFQFAVKLPKTITHSARLEGTADLLTTFVSEAELLGQAWGYLLVQLPPSLSFAADIAERFFRDLRARISVPVVCEPRHESWFSADADELLAGCEIARVAADPARVPAAALPGGWRGLTYYRLHGSPQVYRSSYDRAWLAALALRIQDEESGTAVVIFDNTTLGAATRNALDLAQMMPTKMSATDSRIELA